MTGKETGEERTMILREKDPIQELRKAITTIDDLVAMPPREEIARVSREYTLSELIVYALYYSAIHESKNATTSDS